MIASVSGMRMIIAVPTPGWESIVSEPSRSSMLVLTTSMPTPRPDTSVTCWAVEKPGSRIKANSSRGDILSSSDSVLSRMASALARTACGIDAPPIIANFDANLAVFVRCRERDLSGRRLAIGGALFGRLDAVVDTVADQMGERIRQLFEDRLVELDLPADDRHLDLFAELPSEVANHPRKFPEQIADRLHPRPQDRLLKRGSDRARVAARWAGADCHPDRKPTAIGSGSVSARRSES